MFMGWPLGSGPPKGGDMSELRVCWICSSLASFCSLKFKALYALPYEDTNTTAPYFDSLLFPLCSASRP